MHFESYPSKLRPRSKNSFIHFLLSSKKKSILSRGGFHSLRVEYNLPKATHNSITLVLLLVSKIVLFASCSGRNFNNFLKSEPVKLVHSKFFKKSPLPSLTFVSHIQKLTPQFCIQFTPFVLNLPLTLSKYCFFDLDSPNFQSNFL